MNLTEFQTIITGKRIALVGNAKSLFGKKQGSAIDSHELVMRFNFGEIKSPRDQGSRTDLYGLSDARIEWDYIATHFHPKVAIWLTPKPLSEKLQQPSSIPLFRTPESVAEELSLGTSPGRPSSGLIACGLLMKECGARSIDLYGFDFFQSGTFYHGIRWRFWRKKRMPHDGSSEKKMIERMGITVH